MTDFEDKIELLCMKVKNNRLKTFFVCIIIINLIVLSAQIPFWIGKYWGVTVNYNANDLILFYGSIVSASATVFLGVIAYSQNLKLSTINSELIKIQNQALIPVVDVLQDNVSSKVFSMNEFSGKKIAFY